MEKLTEKDIIKMMREEYERRVSLLDKALCEFVNLDNADDKRGIVGVDTKVRHKGSKLLYTVHEVSPRDITLRTPTGDLFTLSDEEFENEYELS